MKQQLEETLRNQPLIVIFYATDKKYLISLVRVSCTVFQSGQQMGDRTLPSLEHCSVQQTSTDADGIASTQMEARNPESPPAKSSHASPTLQHERTGFSVSQTELSTTAGSRSWLCASHCRSTCPELPLQCSTASQVGATAWFVPTVLWIWLGTLASQMWSACS